MGDVRGVIYKVYYDGASWDPGKHVHIVATIEVEAESEEEWII